jgi:hypothetical protein
MLPKHEVTHDPRRSKTSPNIDWFPLKLVKLLLRNESGGTWNLQPVSSLGQVSDPGSQSTSIHSRRKLTSSVLVCAQVPYLVDPNTGTSIGDSEKIVEYLFKTYGQASATRSDAA